MTESRVDAKNSIHPKAPATSTGGRTTQEATRAPQKPQAAPRKTKSTKSTSKASLGNQTHRGSKRAVSANNKKTQILALLHRPKGSTLAELMKVTGWQALSVRGFLSGTVGKKLGLKLKSTKPENGERVYSIG